ncbi:MAG: UDP-N-acetylmuramoyl-L-alanine--D-glutamate ligase [Clostridia bacterium]|nr:UDP-N-acetylmuramoyl-L-alanine--D-glutamate ligase [Clostridia bacterium]MDD4665139.1 UDP-N-acetylmuramoyl-L-alanine--D-glutamate ligase [Clostridia bacterium]
MEIRGKRFLVIGAARSGQAVASFLIEHGALVFLNDLKKRDDLAGDLLEPLEKRGVHLILGQHPVLSELSPDFLIVSPGVPFSIPPLLEARKKGLPVWSEIELASRFTKASLAAVTGTNGKTTTTTLLGKIFSDSGRQAFVRGNIGTPLISKVEEMRCEDVAVLEVSSFQLATTETFQPHVALLLNITPDHIDRHDTFEGYIEAKKKIFINQKENDWLILNEDDPETRKLAGQARGRVLFFSRQHILKEGFCVVDGWLVVRSKGETRRFLKVEDLGIKGGHNVENALAAAAAAWVMGVGTASIADSLHTFLGVEHRLEPVLTYQGVTYINDSKGTNPDASIKALEAYEQPIILIAGGKSKGSDFLPFAVKIKERVKNLVLVGQAAMEIEAAVRKVGYTKFQHVSSFAEAVKQASLCAEEGDIVLLSPACASFDLFANFEQRGDVFKELVQRLACENS